MKYLQDIKDVIRFKETETYQTVINLLDTEDEKARCDKFFRCFSGTWNGLEQFVYNILLKSQIRSEQKAFLKEFFKASPQKVSSQQTKVPDNLQNTRV